MLESSNLLGKARVMYIVTKVGLGRAAALTGIGRSLARLFLPQLLGVDQPVSAVGLHEVVFLSAFHLSTRVEAETPVDCVKKYNLHCRVVMAPATWNAIPKVMRSNLE